MGLFSLYEFMVYLVYGRGYVVPLNVEMICDENHHNT